MSVTAETLADTMLSVRQNRTGVLSLPEYLIATDFPAQVERAGQLRNVLDDVETILRRRVAMGEHEYTAVTLWIAHSYVYQHFNLTPRLLITSADAGYGKSRAAKVITDTSKDAQKFETMVTHAFLARIRKENPGGLTLVLDQQDNAFDMKAQGTGPLIDKLIATADKGSKAGINTEVKGQGWKPEGFDLFVPMVLVKIGGLPSRALQSRCITIQMHPATAEEAKRLAGYTDAMLARDVARLTAARYGRLLHRTMAERAEGLARRELYFEYGLINRALDKWRPLLTIAEAAGVKWTRRAQLAVKALEPEEEERPNSRGANVLARLMPALADFPHAIIFSTEVDNLLGGPQQAKIRRDALEEVGLHARRQRRDGERLWGYVVAEIRRAGEQYLGHPGTGGTAE
jgi:Protein of unknown function (DUF3631)